ncbi:hypothetical protein M5X00_26250 [Paenibacillus alvei]|uniref:hypothetical protein n=1 Tax=Paenibacillus alvei TaxID=44250 RepID=UPI002282BBDB|nr:hypothetical protein [Paenibacillus alvei]MCY9757734.1 hypothetical protein [Paenibacillus alvei]
MRNRFELLQEVVQAVDNGSPNTVDNVLDLLQEQGIVKNMHVGKQKEVAGFFDNEVHAAEWYLGGFYAIIEENAWFAMNSLINQSYSYLKRIRKENPELFAVNI